MTDEAQRPTAAARANNQTSEDYEFSEFFVYGFIPLLIAGIIVMCVTVPLSFHYVPYDSYALKQDVYGSVDLSTVYAEGRYFFPLNYNMVGFMSTYQSVFIEANVFTETGVQFTVDFSFFWRLPQKSVPFVYNLYSNSYPDLVMSNARTTIKNTAANLNIELYFTNHTQVQALFATKVASTLLNLFQVEVPLDFFKIGSLQLPFTLLNSSLSTAISLQQNDILTRQQAVSVYQAETATLVAAIDAKTNQILSYAVNGAELLVQNANSYANQVAIQARGNGITSMLKSLGFDGNATQTLQIVKQLALIDNYMNTSVVSVTGESFLFQV